MPKISLVICIYKERDLLERLLQYAVGCYDDLVVVHDGPEEGDPNWIPGPPAPELAIDWASVPPDAPLPDVFAKCQNQSKPGSLREFVEGKRGRFFEHPRVGSLEGQSPFAWWAAKHNWILRLDADELPSKELREWLIDFRRADKQPNSFMGYASIWPLWNGKRKTTEKWPDNRLFLFDKSQASFLGCVEFTPLVKPIKKLTLTLHHKPNRKSYGIRNILFRPQAYTWRSMIAQSLMKTPFELPRWNWRNPEWPPNWQHFLADPLFESVYRLLKFPLEQTRNMIAHNERFSLSVCLNPALHHFLLGLTVWKLRGYKPGPWKSLKRAVRSLIIKTIRTAISSRSSNLCTLGALCPWTCEPSRICGDSFCVSGGVGGDISFEIDLADQTGCKIHLFDPSPTGLATIKCLHPLHKNIQFYPQGLAASVGEVSFAPPHNPEEGSFRQPCTQEPAPINLQTTTIHEHLLLHNKPEIDLLKIDIEGFEYEVLDSMLADNILPRQLLVEFHYGKEEPHSVFEYLRALIRLRRVGYRLVHVHQNDHTFIR